MKKYFVYELKKSLVPFLIIAFAGIIIYAVPLSLENAPFRSYYTEYIGYLMVVLGAACALMPIWLFSYKMKRRSTDLYYSLPMTRTKQLIVRYVVGFIVIVAAYTVAYLLGFLITVIKFYPPDLTRTDLKLIYYLPLYFATIIPAYIIYSISSFAFTRANSETDGIFFIIFAAFAVFLMVLFISTFTKYYVPYDILNPDSYTYADNYIYSGYFFPFTMLDQVTCVFQGLICGETLQKCSPFADMSDPAAINIAISFALYTAISIGCTVGLIMTEHTCKAENCNQVSDSVFGYKTMLPLILFTVCSILDDWFASAAMAMLFIIYVALIYLLAAIYKKKFKIGWKYALVLLASLALGIIFGFITGGIF